MADVIVIGAGLGGLTTAMVLALDGHEVTVLERDPEPPPPDPDQAWRSWTRRGVNQFRLPHLMLSAWRESIERELPVAVEELEARGALRWNPIDALPDRLTGPRREEDDRFEILTARRPVLEAAMAAAAARTSGVSIRRGVVVAGLLSSSIPPAPVHVSGVCTGDGDELRADLVVVCGGRRSALHGWLVDAGAPSPQLQVADSGFIYYARHFRSPDGTMPELSALMQVPHGSVSMLTLPADNGIWSVVILASSRDRELRALRHPDVWHRVVARFPHAAPWAEGEPLGGIDVMAKIEDRWSRLVVNDEPVATGVVAVGDAWAATNPSLGRGASLAARHACALRDLLREASPAEPDKFARRFDEVTEAVVTPWYRETLAFDRNRLGEIHAEMVGRDYDTDDPTWAISNAFRTAAYHDPEVLRGFLDVVSMLAHAPDAVSHPGRFERILEVTGGGRPERLPGPDRKELLAVVG